MLTNNIKPIKIEPVDMKYIYNRDPLFIFVFSYVMPHRELDFDFKFSLTEKICNKLIKFGHNKKGSDIKEMYVRYYISGYLNAHSFEKIISDGIFHTPDFEASQKFFIEVYFGNRYLVKSFYEETFTNPFSSQENKKMYLKWLEENFKLCYDQYHKGSKTFLDESGLISHEI